MSPLIVLSEFRLASVPDRYEQPTAMASCHIIYDFAEEHIYFKREPSKHRHAKRAGVIFSIDWVAWGKWVGWDGLCHGLSFLCMVHH